MTEKRPLITNKNELRLLGSLGLFLLVLIVISVVAGNRVYRGSISSPAKVADTKDPFEGIALTAKAAYVYDMRTKEVLFEKNADDRLPLASLTKVMTAVVATDIASDHQVITVTSDAIQADGDSGLNVGERWSLKNLLDFSLTSSSNDGATAIALALGAIHTTNPTPEASEIDFISSMNKKADELGMLNTYYFNETGLDESEKKSGAYGSAEDMATLFSYILKDHPSMLEATRHSHIDVVSLDNILHTAYNTDTIVTDIPGIKGSKTGFTDIAGGNLVIAFDPELGRPIIISVLGSTAADRFTDVQKLVTATLQTLSKEGSK